MSNIDETELARLEALAGKASKGPFFVIETDDAMSMSSIYISTESKEYELGEKPESVVAVTLAQSGGRVACHHDFLWLENAHYIAAACNNVPALVAEVRRLREDRAAMLRDMDAVKTKAEPCDDCWTIYMIMREMGIEEKNWFHRDVCARLTAMQNAEKENAALREKVEAWEWLDEVETLYGNLGWSFDRKQCAIDELYATLVAARAAIGGI